MISLIDENFSRHAWKIPSQADRMEVTHLENLTYVDSSLSCDTFNIIHIHNGLKLSQEEISTAINHYKSRDLDYCVWVNDENLNSEVSGYLSKVGVSRQNSEVGMILNLSAYQPKSDQNHQNIVVVDNKESLKIYAAVIAKNWNPPDQNVHDYYEQTSQHYLNKSNGIILLIYYHDNAPVSTIELFPTGETIGLYGFATLASHRGLGIGTTLMTYALNIVRELGYRSAILQASEDGIGIYRKFGFEELTNYFEYA